MNKVFTGPLDDGVIGSWVIRETEDGHQRPLTRPHYVQSVVAGDAITYCGRRLRDKPGSVFRVVEPFGYGVSPCGNCPYVEDPDADPEALD